MKTLEYLKKLTDELALASEIYYRNNGVGGTMSDTDFDLKFKELQSLEKELGVVYPNSPTQRVGDDSKQGFGKITHPFPMLTIDNTYDDNGLIGWNKKISSKNKKGTYNVSLKYDGVSCEIHYHFGEYVSAATRGDKLIGDDITENVKYVKDVPMFIEELKFVRDFYVRGEVLMPKSVLTKLNQEREKEGETPFRNTRNACSGSLKQLDSTITKKRGLIFRPWDAFYPQGVGWFPTMDEKKDVLKRHGFKIEDGTEPIKCTESNLVETVNAFKKKVDSLNLDYDYDGVVVKIDDCATQIEIGTKDTRAIEWGIARKWNEEYEVWTELQGVEWQVGRTGVVTPVGLLDPVECAGVTISNVTLHNADFVQDFDLHIGNDLKITRSGGVIPYVLEVKHDLLMEMHGAHPKVQIPEFCPICGGKLVMDGKLLKCTNENCKAKAIGKIIQFCSKDCCDIRSMGEKVIEDLYDAELITSIRDITFQAYRACIDSCKEYDIKKWVKFLGKGYGEKSVRNMMDAMAYARLNTSYDRIIGGLSIPGVGKTMARALCKRFNDVYSLEHATVEELMEIEGIAEITAKNIYDWLQTDEARITLDGISSDQWNWMNEAYDEINEDNESNKPLEGLKVCFTGKSFRFKGDEVEEFLKENGAEIGGVSKSLNYLITGDKPGGSKVEKATSLGITIINEEDFYGKYDI